MLLKLIEAQIAVYSPHTCFDSASHGINQRLAEGLGIVDPLPLQPIEQDPDGLGAGRYGRLASPLPLSEFLAQVGSFLNLDGLQCVGEATQTVSKVAVACGSAGQFLQTALRVGCDCLVTGETNFHTCLEAKASNAALVLPGHYASERFAVEALSQLLKSEFPAAEVWPSVDETDPLRWVSCNTN
jgi:dinuclear metal center YbgI/SA1388 family protein